MSEFYIIQGDSRDVLASLPERSRRVEDAPLLAQEAP